MLHTPVKHGKTISIRQHYNRHDIHSETSDNHCLEVRELLVLYGTNKKEFPRCRL